MNKNKSWIIILLIIIGAYWLGVSGKNQSSTNQQPAITPTLNRDASFYDQQIENAQRRKKEAAQFYAEAYKKGMSDIDIAYFYEISCNKDPQPITEAQKASANWIFPDNSGPNETFTINPTNFNDWLKDQNESIPYYKNDPFRGTTASGKNWNKEFKYDYWRNKCGDFALYQLRVKNGGWFQLTPAQKSVLDNYVKTQSDTLVPTATPLQ